MKRIGLLVAILSAVPRPVVAGSPAVTMETCSDSTVAGPLGEALDRRLREAAQHGFEGAVIVVRQGRPILCRGYGATDSTGEQAVDTSTRFYVASVAKQFTAAGILLLAEEGRLSLDDPVSRFFPGTDERAGRITLHELLTHRAGFDEDYRMDGIAERGAAVNAVLDSPPPEEPGTVFRYSNDAYGLLAAVIEVVSDQSWESFVRRRLLEPAGMHSTVFWGQVDVGDTRRFAAIHDPVSREIRLPNWGFRGSGGLWSTAADLQRWFEALWIGPLLSPKSRALLFRRHFVLDSGIGIGYGSFTTPAGERSLELWARGAEDFGHNAVIRWFPADELLVIVVSNSGDIGGTSANRVISDAILEIVGR